MPIRPRSQHSARKRLDFEAIEARRLLSAASLYFTDADAGAVSSTLPAASYVASEDTSSTFDLINIDQIGAPTLVPDRLSSNRVELSFSNIRSDHFIADADAATTWTGTDALTLPPSENTVHPVFNINLELSFRDFSQALTLEPNDVSTAQAPIADNLFGGQTELLRLSPPTPTVEPNAGLIVSADSEDGTVTRNLTAGRTDWIVSGALMYDLPALEGTTPPLTIYPQPLPSGLKFHDLDASGIRPDSPLSPPNTTLQNAERDKAIVSIPATDSQPAAEAAHFHQTTRLFAVTPQLEEAIIPRSGDGDFRVEVLHPESRLRPDEGHVELSKAGGSIRRITTDVDEYIDIGMLPPPIDEDSAATESGPISHSVSKVVPQTPPTYEGGTYRTARRLEISNTSASQMQPDDAAESAGDALRLVPLRKSVGVKYQSSPYAIDSATQQRHARRISEYAGMLTTFRMEGGGRSETDDKLGSPLAERPRVVAQASEIPFTTFVEFSANGTFLVSVFGTALLLSQDTVAVNRQKADERWGDLSMRR